MGEVPAWSHGHGRSAHWPEDRAIELRSAEREDEAFLYRVYASTRTDELAVLDWSEAQKEAFLQMQFTAQHRHYHNHYPDAAYQIILVNGVPAGRLYVDRREDEILLIDIALLPEYRNNGIGTALLSELLAEADVTGKPVRLHVEPFNPALRLYQRLGFSTVAERGVYWFMERPPEREAGR
jgi:ribosomal protein S18 acetylase RimI-like enzyme